MVLRRLATPVVIRSPMVTYFLPSTYPLTRGPHLPIPGDPILPSGHVPYFGYQPFFRALVHASVVVPVFQR